MVPRADIVAVQQDIPLGDLVKVFENAAHSRLVVYNDTLDDPIGMVHIRDLIAFMTAHATVARRSTGAQEAVSGGARSSAIDLAMPLSATKIIRTILFVPPSMPAIDLLAKMQAIRIHLALVIDEYGGTDGLVSIEDIVEEIVGDIEDEHDEAGEHPMIRQTDGSFLADRARQPRRRGRGDRAANSMSARPPRRSTPSAGFIVTLVGRVPVRGELVPGPGPFEIEMLDADPRRVKRVSIYRSATDAAAGRTRRLAPGGGGAARPTVAPAAVTGGASGRVRPCRGTRRRAIPPPPAAHAAVKPASLAHPIILAWGWRRAADRVPGRRRHRRWRWRRSMSGRRCS